MTRSFGIQIDPLSNEAFYKQIFDQVTRRIRNETLPGGTRLPPTRKLAAELNTHRNTVVRAYQELAGAGYVQSTVGRGTFVCGQARPVRQPSRNQQPSLPWSSLVSRTALVEPLGRLDRLRRSTANADLIDLSRMQPPNELLPHELLRRCLDQVMRTLGPRALGYASREGLLRLRELVVADLARLGVAARTDEVLITTGSQQALDLIARTLINPGDRILTDGPSYSGAINVFAAAGAELVCVPNDDQGPDLLALQHSAKGGVKGLYLMPNCHNPVGSSISDKRRKELITWSHQVGVPLIEDDYAADLNLDDVPESPPMRALDAEILHLGTFSKKLIPALRIGYLVVPKALRMRIAALKHAMDLGTSALMQHALAEFLERGYLQTHLQHTLPIYRARRDALESGLAAHLPRQVRWQHQRRGLVLWLHLPSALDPELVFAEALRQGVVVNPGSLYAVGSDHSSGLRLSFCYESPDRLNQGTLRLGRALELALRRKTEQESQSTTAPLEGA